MWRQSNTGMWHKIGGQIDGKDIAKCQSYNLDRLNVLSGETAQEPPIDSKACKKCKGKK